jgi:O-antigen/teichoic acid export membrane protein
MSAPDRPSETEAERADRNFTELLQELRVAQTGVQILFAFLLTLPFQARFSEQDTFGLVAYGMAILSAALAAVCLIAPVAYHRILFRQQEKDWVVVRASLLANVGVGFLAVAIVSALALVLQVVYSRTWSVIIAVVMAVLIVSMWWVVPLVRRQRE